MLPVLKSPVWSHARRAPSRTRRHALAAVPALVLSLSLSPGVAASAPLSGAPAASAYGLDQPDAAVLDGPRMFVANYGGNSLTEVNASSGALISAISGPSYDFSSPVALKLIGQRLFVANRAGASVTELSATTGAFVRSLSGASYRFAKPVAMASEGSRFLFVLSSAGAGSVDKVSVTTGKLVARAAGAGFGFNKPAAIVDVGNRLFVANTGGNSVTVLNAQTMGLVQVLSDPAATPTSPFDAPLGLVAAGGDVWVANNAGLSLAELSASTGAVVQVVPNTNDYLPAPAAMAYGDGFLFVTSPPGGSPMVTQVVPTSPATLPWMMCNSNGPYTFSNPQAMVIYGTNLWVVNEGGAGGPTGDSLTEMNASTGWLIQVVR